MFPTTRIEAFINRVSPEPNTGCWLWAGAYRGKYPAFGDYYGHRFAYEAFVGPIEDGHDVCHVCDMPMCVNPSHLFSGTRRDNIRDMIWKRRAHWQLDEERNRRFGREGRKARGEDNGKAKLTDRDVVLIRRLSGLGAPNVVLAAAFEVSEPVISAVVRQKTWRHA